MPADDDLERRARSVARGLAHRYGLDYPAEDEVMMKTISEEFRTVHEAGRRAGLEEAIAEERERCAAICDARRAPCAAHAIRDGVQRDGPGRQEILDALGAALMYQDDTDRFAAARAVYESAIRKGPGDG